MTRKQSVGGGGKNSVKPNVSQTFIAGRNYLKSEKAVADALRTDDPDKQEGAKSQLKLGMMAARLYPEVDVTPALVETIEAILQKKASDKTELERRAEAASRTAISRIFSRYNIVNLESRGGSNKISADERMTERQSVLAVANGSPMRVSSTQFSKEVALYQEVALRSPVIVARNGLDRTVLISVSEYRKLGRRR